MVNRIVVDTSVFVSALIGSTGPSRELIRRCLLKDYQPLMGNALFSEYEAVIGRDYILDRCRLTKIEIDTLFQAFISVCKWTFIYYTWRPNLKDEADNHLIELAVAGNAQIIATQNIRDFQNAELLFPDLQILTPADLLNR
ncbi:putative toxin-antitoxin system toxin component, PIN family [Leptolyngbya sp. CCNP1308]|uniref:putative toxin-antitoxin system toxin component, PIN family n=1 Tax=Leptolyngbya sp. CCNP1308 TaxID=3110255 RepID=UPI002B221997|nr:putative toxin-antitoxin system toxin component, PIN family [Leptolyngbya sp. CCNP1308]MEA5449495.1 putative toxin-antitoxin system toxin component, PIN family [Leptolyngbya sp. CCNP1308]